MTEKFLSRSDFAKRIGVTVNTLGRYKLPKPDVEIGIEGRSIMGWRPETIDAWNQARPGRGNWGHRQQAD